MQPDHFADRRSLAETDFIGREPREETGRESNEVESFDGNQLARLNQEEAQGTIFGSIVSLAATTMGAGILSLPISIYYCGLVLGVAMLILFATLSDISLLYLLRAATLSRCYGFMELGKYCFGESGRRAVVLVLVALLFAACVSLIVVMAGLFQPVLAAVVGCTITETDTNDCPWFASYAFVATACVILLYPLTLPRSLHVLECTSAAALVSILFAAVAVIGLYVSGPDGFAVAPGVAAVGHPLSRIMLALPIQACAFCNQFNWLPIYSELNPTSRDKCDTNVPFFWQLDAQNWSLLKIVDGCAARGAVVVHGSILLVCLFYILFGSICYLMFGSDTGNYPNILNAFSTENHLMLVVSLTTSDVACLCATFDHVAPIGLFLRWANQHAEVSTSIAATG
eukprot:SAG31_NODE_2755_length_5141_cov_1.849266_4_plen_399_part_00